MIVWKLWAPALSFAQGFRSLLERPTGSTGLWPFLKGRETVGGEYDGRPVLLILHHKRGRNTLGYLVVAMQPAGRNGHGDEVCRGLPGMDSRAGRARRLG